MEGDSTCSFHVWILGDNEIVKKRFQTLLVEVFKLDQQKTQLLTRSMFSNQLRDFNASTVRVVIVVPFERRQIVLNSDVESRTFHKEIQRIGGREGNIQESDCGMVQTELMRLQPAILYINHSLMSLFLVMFAVYYEGLHDYRCCSKDAMDRFVEEGGQTDLQTYIDNKRFLTLKRDGSINIQQAEAIAEFLQVDVPGPSDIVTKPPVPSEQVSLNYCGQSHKLHHTQLGCHVKMKSNSLQRYLSALE